MRCEEGICAADPRGKPAETGLHRPLALGVPVFCTNNETEKSLLGRKEKGIYSLLTHCYNKMEMQGPSAN